MVLTGARVDVEVMGERDTIEHEDVLLFTSGTTSRPKGVRLSMDALLHNVAATQSYLQISDDDRVAVPLPVHYSYGLSTLNLSLHVGAALTFFDYSQPPITWLADVMRSNPTVLALLPHQARLLLRAPAFCGKRLPALRTITIAGGALGRTATDELVARFPDTQVFLMYGQTEAGPRISFVPPSALTGHAGSIGRGIAGHTTLRLADETAAVSELQVSSPSLMLGYLDDEDRSPIVDGWLSTGDLARVDADGFFTLVGRCAPFFNPLDERVSFDEIIDAAQAVFPGATFRFRTIAHAIRGEALELTALVDGENNRSSERENLRALQRRLGTARAPVAIHVVQRNEGRKLD
jgi:acyl-CoA synthetase (AMP-forming)/AMP-acid ligase II